MNDRIGISQNPPNIWDLIRHGIWGKIIAICVLGPDMLSFFLTDRRCQLLVNDYVSQPVI